MLQAPVLDGRRVGLLQEAAGIRQAGLGGASRRFPDGENAVLDRRQLHDIEGTDGRVRFDGRGGAQVGPDRRRRAGEPLGIDAAPGIEQIDAGGPLQIAAAMKGQREAEVVELKKSPA